MAEEWRPVPGFEEWYEVSSLGSARSWKNGRRGRRAVPRTLRLMADGKGYLFFNATLPPDVRRMVRVHQAMCEAWHGPAGEGQVLVRHRNGNHLDNRPENLTWGTKSENLLDAIEHGAWAPHNAKLTASQVMSIRREARMGGLSQAAIARRHGVSPSIVFGVLHGRTYSTVA